MTSPRTNGLISGLLLLAALLVASPLAAQPADVEAVSPGEPYFEQAATHYAARDYASAIPFLLQAIQADPHEPRFYRGLARAAHYAEDFETATWFYDLYLTTFPEHAPAERSRDNREEAIRAERERANGSRASSETPPALPETQTAVLVALEQRPSRKGLS